MSYVNEKKTEENKRFEEEVKKTSTEEEVQTVNRQRKKIKRVNKDN